MRKKKYVELLTRVQRDALGGEKENNVPSSRSCFWENWKHTNKEPWMMICGFISFTF